MQYKNQLNNEIQFVHTIKLITQTYEEISVIKMQQIRDSVVKTRHFLSILSEVFQDVKISYKQQIEEFLAKKNKKGFSKFVSQMFGKETLHKFSYKNNKTVSVFLSANMKLNGEITARVFRDFVKKAQKDNSDLVIVGRIGRSLFEQGSFKRAYKYYELPEIGMKLEDLKELVTELIPYDKIDVSYGKFESIVVQNPIVSNISGDEPFQQVEADAQNVKQAQHFLFEPTLEEILKFFETQVFSALFKQSVHESNLSRHGSRIKAMEEALVNIDKKRNILYSQKRRLNHLVENSKQLERLSGISLWH